MTRYFRTYLKALVTNPSLIFWAVIWIAIWVSVWVYVYGVDMPAEYVKIYQSLTYSSLYVLMISSAAVGITYSLIYSSRAVRYVTKYTKLSPARYHLENALASLAMLSIYTAIYLAMVTGFFYSRYGLAIPPEKPFEFVGIALLCSLFMYLFSFFLHLLVIISRAPRLVNQLVSFTPVIFGLLLGTLIPLYTDIKWLAIVSPFNAAVALTYYSYSGETLSTGNYVLYLANRFSGRAPGLGAAEPLLALAMISIWIAILSLLNLILLRKVRGISIEELRAA